MNLSEANQGTIKIAMRKSALILFLLFVVVGRAMAAKLPNVVIIYAEDMGFGDLGANNPDSKMPTPNLDQLAKERNTLYGWAQIIG